MTNFSGRWHLVTVGASYAKVGQKVKASELLSSALPLIKSYEPAPSVEIAVKELALGGTATAFAEIGPQDRAMEAISLAAQSPIMTARDSSKAQYTAQIAAWYMKAGQKAKAVELLHQAFELSKSVQDYIDRSASLEHISENALEAGERELALEIAQAIQKGPFRAGALSKVAISYAKSEEYDKALQVANTLEEISFIPETLIAIGYKYAEAGQREKALKLLDHAFQAANSKDFNSARGRSGPTGLAVAYAKIGQIDKALKMALRDWPKYNPDMESLAEIAVQYFKARQTSKGERVVSLMLQVSRSFDSAHYKASDLASVGGIYIEVGQRVKGLNLLAKALQIAKTEKEDFQRNYVLSEIAMKYVAAKEYDEALMVADESRGSDKAMALAAIAVKYFEANSRK